MSTTTSSAPASPGDRPQRSDAARNRRRLLEAATALFAEHGLDAGVAEIAARAGVGRGTLFRNFPTKEDLIAAIVVERMHAAIGEGRERFVAARESDAGGEIVFEFIHEIVRRQQSDRALFEAVSEQFLANPEIAAAHGDFIQLIDEMLVYGKQGGVVRDGVGPMDVMMLIKGVCSAAVELEASPELLERHIDLVCAAIAAPGYAVPLRGRAPTLEDMAHASPAGITPPAPGPGAAA